jgi:hypothetical protein
MTDPTNDEVKQWCKIVQTDKGPVLFWLDYSQKEETDIIHQVFKFKGVCADMKVSGFDKPITQDLFNTLTSDAAAELVVKTVIDFMDGEQ